MPELVLTNVYLGSEQKKAIARKAKANRTNMSVEIRRAVDAYLAGMSAEELRMVDEATRRTKRDIDDMNKVLDGGLKRADRFFREIEQIKAGARS
jgi:hypothetical protein